MASEVISVRIDKELKEWLGKKAEDEKRSRNFIVDSILTEAKNKDEEPDI